MVVLLSYVISINMVIIDFMFQIVKLVLMLDWIQITHADTTFSKCPEKQLALSEITTLTTLKNL